MSDRAPLPPARRVPAARPLARHLLARRALATALVVGTLSTPARAQAPDLDAWRARLAEQQERLRVAREAIAEFNSDTRTFDAAAVGGGIAIHFARGALTPADSAALADGLEAAVSRLRERFGDAGPALVAGERITARADDRRPRSPLALWRVGGGVASLALPRPVDARVVEAMVLTLAGQRLVARTPALARYDGTHALRPERVNGAEVARHLVISRAAVGRRCADGVLESCRTLLAPFSARDAFATYFEPSDYRLVVRTGRLPTGADSALHAAHTACVDQADAAACARVARAVLPSDPFNSMVRGTLLTRAVVLGGSGALARAAERPDAPPLELLSHIAGVPVDSLVAEWHHATFAALAERRDGNAPYLVASMAWAGLLLLAASRRRFL